MDALHSFIAKKAMIDAQYASSLSALMNQNNLLQGGGHLSFDDSVAGDTSSGPGELGSGKENSSYKSAVAGMITAFDTEAKQLQGMASSLTGQIE